MNSKVGLTSRLHVSHGKWNKSYSRNGLNGLPVTSQVEILANSCTSESIHSCVAFLTSLDNNGKISHQILSIVHCCTVHFTFQWMFWESRTVQQQSTIPKVQSTLAQQERWNLLVTKRISSTPLPGVMHLC